MLKNGALFSMGKKFEIILVLRDPNRDHSYCLFYILGVLDYA